MKVRVYARDLGGALVKFEADGVDSYDQAINMVKMQTKSPRALCVVDNARVEQALPTEPEKVVNE
jgi:hypothetical protein